MRLFYPKNSWLSNMVLTYAEKNIVGLSVNYRTEQPCEKLDRIVSCRRRLHRDLSRQKTLYGGRLLCDRYGVGLANPYWGGGCRTGQNLRHFSSTLMRLACLSRSKSGASKSSATSFKPISVTIAYPKNKPFMKAKAACTQRSNARSTTELPKQ